MTSPGFTLIEILLTLSITIILLAISLPMFNTFLASTQENLLQRQLLQALNFARDSAVAKHIPISLCKSKNYLTCSGNWLDGQIIFMDENQDGIIHSKSQIIRIMQNQTRKGILYWRSYPKYRDYVLFLPKVLLQNTNGTFWYCAMQTSKPSWAIILSQSGKIRIAYPDKKGEIKNGHGEILKCETK